MSDVNLDQARERFASTVRAIWWLTLIRGISLIALGAYALFAPKITLVALAQVVGVFMMLDGMLAIWAAISGQTPTRLWTALRGALLILAGLFILGQPLIMAVLTAKVMIYLLAGSVIASGIIEIYVAVRDRQAIKGEGWLMLGGALAIIFGLLLASCPITAAATIVRIFGVFAIIAGIALLGAAFSLRGFGKDLKHRFAPGD
jgi:uncharacterized membrane protein HdeD (DUF308 family)